MEPTKSEHHPLSKHSTGGESGPNDPLSDLYALLEGSAQPWVHSWSPNCKPSVVKCTGLL